MDAYILTARLFKGEELTPDEKAFLRKRNAKYETVRYLYLEKMKGAGLTDFHFTPGDDFINTPTIDIVNALLDMRNAPSTPLDFGDLSWKKAGPPETGRKKSKLTNE